MSIRLNKALRELNIGLQTAVEFLEKRSELGEVKAEPSFKLNDAQYAALVEAFKQDKELHTKAETLLQKKPKEKKPTEEKKAPEPAPVTTTARQIFKPLGKLDPGSLIRKVLPKGSGTNAAKTPPKDAAAVPSPAAVADATPPQEEHTAPQNVDISQPEKAVVAAPDERIATTQEPQTPPQQPAAQPTASEAPADKESVADAPPSVADAPQQSDVTPQQSDATAETEPKPTKEVFTTKSEQKILSATKVNVLGKIDLNAINQSTRPKKKTKEEKRHEREASAQQQSTDKKKRERINKVRIDINAASNQPSQSAAATRRGDDKKKKAQRKSSYKPAQVSDEDVARQVKETLARLTNKQSQSKKGAKYRKEKRDAVHERMDEERMAESRGSKTLKLTEFVTVSELANMMDVPVNKLIGTLMSVGIMVSINQRLDAETINLVAGEFGFTTEYVSAEVQEAITEDEDDENDLVPRAPIVTVMGHVDHGKTSLLDYIRKTNVIAGEAGGITQHIGAYHVTLDDGRQITFLDTPGHEAFTAMRARGAQVTDIAIIIIAADDSVMPTTKEAIAHAQAANVPMVFAINKIDKPGANAEKIREDLANMNLLVEDWGGKYQCQEISAKKGIGVQDLLEKVLLEAELLDLKANPNRRATGSIIESRLDKGRGYISTVLVSNGTLRVGDNIIAGTSHGRIKAMFNERDVKVETAGPAEPVMVLGLNGAPSAGDSFHILDSELEAREIANKRMQLQREQGLRTQKRLTLDDISHRIALGSFKELNIVVKGDTDGSVEALSDSFIKLSTEKIKVNVIHKAVGQISEGDVTLADVSDAIIVGFQVRPSAIARKQAEQEGIEINTYSVIYDAIDDVKAAMEGMLDKVKKEIVTGQAEVREVYKISKVGTVAGAMVTEGKVHRSDKVRVVRDGIVVYTADINALKRFKDDVKEVATNFECGISLVNFNDIQQGDILETFTVVEVQQKL